MPFQDWEHDYRDCLTNTEFDELIRQHTRYQQTVAEQLARWLADVLRGLARRIGDRVRYR